MRHFIKIQEKTILATRNLLNRQVVEGESSTELEMTWQKPSSQKKEQNLDLPTAGLGNMCESCDPCLITVYGE